MKNNNTLLLLLLFSLVFASCSTNERRHKQHHSAKRPQSLVKAKAPAFNPDSAFYYIKKQVDFGPRVPNTRSHVDCGNWIVEFLKSHHIDVIEQSFDMVAFDHQTLYMRNIIGRVRPKAKKRILLAAHWDTRPFADKDTVDKDKPIDGANDGASGVGVLMEIARIVAGDSTLNVGVDFLFLDGEDYGVPKDSKIKTEMPYGGYCLGSQYWSKNKHQPNYGAYYGILLDMVGAKDAKFSLEGVSRRFAPTILNKIWSIADKIGFGHYFISKNTSEIIDDHLPINVNAKIPMIDIIEYDGEKFGDYHHTHQDNINVIDKETVKAVGQVVLTALYNE